MPRYYIGLAATLHDPALAIVDPNGKVIFAEATERYLQDKRAYNCPPDNLLRIADLVKTYCTPDAELVAAVTWSKAYLTRIRLADNLFSLLGDFGPRDWLWMKSLEMSLKQASINLRQQVNLGKMFKRGIQNPVSLTYYDHHLTHAATTCFTSPFSEAACAIIDGFGEGASTSFYRYQAGRIQPLTTRLWNGPPQATEGSLGLFYSLVCLLCGFDALKGEEWKVMGLAPYGKFDQTYYDLLKPFVVPNGLGLKYGCSQKEINQRLDTLRAMMRKPGSSPLEAADLAYVGQLIFSETMQALLKQFYQTYPSQHLVLGGGCALNSSWNGEIVERTPFKQVHIFAAPADDGNALGAALLAYYEDHPPRTARATLQSPFLGTDISTETLGNLIKFGRLPRVHHLPGEVHQHTARLLAEGKIIGWMQGRAEFGPRALGNRSILADPRPADMKDRINALVKFREEFRPFAPAILDEFGVDYFEHYQQTPYMERTLRFKPSVQEKVPAVVHVNGTGRLQSVRAEWNEKYYRLIKAFYKLTGIPLILNTSFNIMGKPIIHSVEDAIGVFFTTGLDALVIDDYLIEKG